MYSPDCKRILTYSWDCRIKEWDASTGECINTIDNIPGILISGYSFRSLHNDSDISLDGMKILKQYGAKDISMTPSDCFHKIWKIHSKAQKKYVKNPFLSTNHS
ncbi:hypothetical protein EHE19_012640 [Ruminiclostridium herbifermentans]|uniref:Uncharacterized protein n=1 Tax=Ruminiclostridium herbifermentans TaxID=2488810 RepID=A0A4U7JDV1_9FIRM|nr:hypothetical protein [Ruminiclostridium herbifermentans]QNU65757.1 hypothetical protein EHE19_012640 [Ruminiclostridium herbifermentans]